MQWPTQRPRLHADYVAKQLLAYAGKADLAMEELDLSRLVADLADLIAVSLPKGVEVTYALAEDLPAVTGDASQLRQIVMNLILNGAEASGDSEGTVLVETGLELAAPLSGDARPRAQVVLQNGRFFRRSSVSCRTRASQR